MSGRLPRFLSLLMAMIAFLSASSAFAATVHTYVQNTSGAVGSTTPCYSPLVRNFTVTDSFTISDVDLGVFAIHTWRGDIRITLQSPSGTRVQLVDGNPNYISGDNFNVLLDDEGTQQVNTDSRYANHSTTTPPPFQHDFSPNSPLSAFDGESSAGTWRMEICDLYPAADNGTFYYSELRLTEQPSNYADLSLSKTVDNASPSSGSNVTFSLALSNSASSPNTATGVTVTDLLPAGVSFVSSSGDGSYDSSTGVWTIASIAPGENKYLSIVTTVTATSGATLTNSAEVTSSSVADIDSTPGNGSTTEDDYDSASVTVSGTRVAGTPPVLSCPKGTLLFDWDGRSWTSGSTSNSYNLTGLGTVSFDLSTGVNYMNIGGQTPQLSNTATGGLSPAQYSLMEGIDFTSVSQIANTVITLPVAVPGAQFTIFDVDYYAGQFADRIKVYGSYQGTPVTPTLTNGTANYVIGNEAFGDVLSDDTQSDGNVVVTFPSPVDTITIEYGNYSAAPSNPGGQAIEIHDITLCKPDATLSVSKTSTIVSDPTNGTTNPAAIPGAVISYCIAISNTGTATASSVAATDPVPSEMTYVGGSMKSGPTCASASTVEDDNATGADESDPVGASFSGGILTLTASSLAGGDAFAVTFDATIN